MKKLTFIIAIAASLMIAACSGGPAEATKKSVAETDSLINVLTQKTSALLDSVTAQNKVCENACGDSEGCSEKDCCKGKADSLKSVCSGIKSELDGLIASLETGKANWDSVVVAFDAYESKLKTMKDEEAKKELESFKVKLDEASAFVSGIEVKFEDAKSRCKAQCEAMDEACTKPCCKKS